MGNGTKTGVVAVVGLLGVTEWEKSLDCRRPDNFVGECLAASSGGIMWMLRFVFASPSRIS